VVSRDYGQTCSELCGIQLIWNTRISSCLGEGNVVISIFVETMLVRELHNYMSET